MNQVAQAGKSGTALAAGFGLSFLALGLLWIGVPTPWQFLMFLPFLIAAFVTRRLRAPWYGMFLGMLPIGALLVQFRDNEGSHASSIALVLSWVVAVAIGNYLAMRTKADSRP